MKTKEIKIDTSRKALDEFSKEFDEYRRAMNNERLHELCKCLPKSPDWQHHKQYCPIWKNGRIEELELWLKAALKISDLWRPAKDIEVEECYAGEAQALESMYQKLKKLLKK